MRQIPKLAPITLLVLGLCALPAQAREAGAWEWGVGVHQVNPKSGNGALAGGALDVDIGSDLRPTITAEYFINEHWGFEILASLPFEHQIDLNGAESVRTRHLPPTFSIQYHGGGEKVSPFIGLGVNHTRFFHVEERGPLAGTRVGLENSWGLALHAGLDFAVGEGRYLRVDARKIDIDTEVSVNGTEVGTAHIDPLVYGVAYVWRF